MINVTIALPLNTMAGIDERSALERARETYQADMAQLNQPTKTEVQEAQYHLGKTAGIDMSTAMEFASGSSVAAALVAVFAPEWFTATILQVAILCTSLYLTRRIWALVHGVKVRNNTAWSQMSYRRVIAGDAWVFTLLFTTAAGLLGAHWWVLVAGIMGTWFTVATNKK